MTTMESVTVDAAVAAAEMPRFDDGCVNMQELARLLIEQVVNEVMDTMAAAAAEDAGTSRNGYRDRTLNTCVGTLELRIPKLRAGNFFPEDVIERYSRTDRAMLAAVVEMYRSGVSTRKVSGVAEALGAGELSKDQVSRICERLDREVEDMNGRLFGPDVHFPYLWLDATYVKCRREGHVASTAVVTAIACDENGNRYVVGFNVVDTESYESWLPFLRGLRDRGVLGVLLVVSDAHGGLTKAIAEVFQGAAWQRCVVHLMRDCCAVAKSKSKRKRVARLLSPVFKAKDALVVRAAYHKAAEMVDTFCPAAAEILDEAEADALAYLDFPPSHWKRLRTNNVQERTNREIKRRSRVVQVFPSPESLIRLVGAIMVDVDDTWQQSRYFSQEKMDELWALVEKRGEDGWDTSLPTEVELTVASRFADSILAAAEVEMEREAA